MQEVSVLATDCAMMLLDSVMDAVPGGSCLLLSHLVAVATFPANLAALQILLARLDQDVAVSDSSLATIVSSLLKVHTFNARVKRLSYAQHVVMSSRRKLQSSP